jgi:hypothetical protein
MSMIEAIKASESLLLFSGFIKYCYICNTYFFSTLAYLCEFYVLKDNFDMPALRRFFKWGEVGPCLGLL